MILSQENLAVIRILEAANIRLRVKFAEITVLM
jgi:hypothetical protein